LSPTTTIFQQPRRYAMEVDAPAILGIQFNAESANSCIELLRSYGIESYLNAPVIMRGRIFLGVSIEKREDARAVVMHMEEMADDRGFMQIPRDCWLCISESQSGTGTGLITFATDKQFSDKALLLR